MSDVFDSFERVLGPVGAAKALHLTAPRLFPLWDRAIAAAHSHRLGTAGSNSSRYWAFLLDVQRQCAYLTDAGLTIDNPLKAIDEFNYCTYTKRWLQ